MKLHFEEYGQENNQYLIILHGLFGSADNWTSLGKQFARSYHVFLIDQRNHGRSPHHDQWNYEVMSDDLNSFLKEKGITSPYIIGHSMGGKTAMKFACSFPNNLQKLVVVDIAPKYYPVHHRSIIDGLQAVANKSISKRKEADEILATYIPELPVRQFLLKNLIRVKDSMTWRMNLDVIDKLIENVGEELSDNESFAKETLFIRGINSNYILDSDSEKIKFHFHKSQLVSIENAGHWVHAEQPKEFIQSVLDFLA